ncbi:MAG: 50S ribosomal protein L25/general stress protein Ctc [Bacteroidales bacterium]|nr:50S ribosomal protein L25/general stress protein Ctc [Bacteroidales bacterium]
MKHFEVKANLRTDLGKKATKAIRKADNVPCVIYGREEVVHFYTSKSAVRKLIYTPEVMFADINIDGKVKYAMTKDIQFHPVSDEILHIDFYEVDNKKPITIQIPIIIEGDSPGVRAGGKLKLNNRKITVRAIMENVPDGFSIDISKLNIGDAIKVKELKSDKLEFVDPKSKVVVMVTTARSATAEEEAEDAAEAEKEAEKEAGEGETDKTDEETTK